MDSWPADCRIRQRDGETTKTTGYLNLMHGSFGALNLRDKGNRLEWTSVLKRVTGNQLISNQTYEDVFPATRPPRLSIPRITVTQRSEQSAHFLRTHFPDVDVASDLIRDQLTADGRVVSELEAFDPQTGNLLDIVYFADAFSDPIACLAFPMGKLNRDLNLSAFAYTERDGVVFEPSAIPIRSFQTPIQQIVSSNSSLTSRAERPTNSHLAVRTFASTSVLDIKTTVNPYSPPHVQLTELLKITPPDIGNKPAVDVSLSNLTSDGGFLVNEVGCVYKYDINGDRRIFRLVHPSARTQDDTNTFWRLALTETNQNCFIASNKSVKLLDFRMKTSGLDVFSAQSDVITSIERPGNDHIFRLVSTSEIVWIDERSPQKPLLGYVHGRQFDRSLSILTVDLPTPSTLLMSRGNGLVTVYDVSRSDDHFIHVNIPPYPLPSILGCNETHAGQVLVRHPSYPNKAEVDFFRLCERGSIHRVTLRMPLDNDSAYGDRCGDYEWSEDVKKLELQAIKLRPDVGPRGARYFTEINLRAIYERLFLVKKNVAEGNARVLGEIKDRIPMLLLESNDPRASILTMWFDVVFRCGEVTDHRSRADFLTQCAINSTSGYQAVLEGCIAPTAVVKTASWSHDIRSVLERLDVDMAESPAGIVDNLRRYDVTLIDPAPESLRRASQAREQLALDLALSADIFSSQTILNPSDQDSDELETMSRAAEALSLGDEPPSIRFGFLRPIAEEDDEDMSQRYIYPTGVRLLLKDWTIGTDPSKRADKDNYDGKEDLQSKVSERPVAVDRQRPPLIISSDARESPTMGTHGFVRSLRSPARSMPSTSQPMLDISGSMAGTQVSSQGRKKVKKRLDGF